MVKGYVYVIGATNSTLHKVGSTKTPGQRLLELQTGNPLKLRIMYLVKTREYLAVERFMKNILARYNSSGEWFNIDYYKIVEYIEQLIDYLPDVNRDDIRDFEQLRNKE